MKNFSNKNSFLLLLHPRKLFIMLLFFAFTLLIYALSASDQIENKFSSMVENDTHLICKESYKDFRQFVNVVSKSSTFIQTSSQKDLPRIYFVTPTYLRREQVAELTRLGQTLMHVMNLFWIVADDSETCNSNIDSLLEHFGLPYVHLSSPMPFLYRAHKSIPRGVSNRRAALSWIKSNNIKEGVLYFGDDDNTFDLRLFDEIRFTNRVSMFPVGLIGDYSVSSPVVKNGKVVAFFDSWPAKRIFPVDMAGFAVNLNYLAKYPNATMPFKAGYEEDAFLKSIGLKLEDIEPKAKNCTETYVWHTQTTKTKSPIIKVGKEVLENTKSNLYALLKSLSDYGVNHFSSSGGVKATVSKDGKSKSLAIWAH